MKAVGDMLCRRFTVTNAAARAQMLTSCTVIHDFLTFIAKPGTTEDF